MSSSPNQKVGKVIQIIGPVIDVEFSDNYLPPIYQALRVTSEGFNVPSPVDRENMGRIGTRSNVVVPLSAAGALHQHASQLGGRTGVQVSIAPQAVKRLIEPSEVADVVAFLTTPAGSAFTGAPVTMDLGWTAR